MRVKINLNTFFSEMNKKKSEINKLVRKKMPVHAGRIAVNHVQENFRKGGFVNNGLTKWKPSNRELHGGNHRTLLSGRNHLYSSTRYVPGDAKVTIKNDLPYAGIHNFGGTITTTVTPRMRAFAWAKFYALGGREQPVAPNVGFWKNFAITTKKKITIKMPQRQFLGESKEMNEAIRAKIDTELEKIFKQ